MTEQPKRPDMDAIREDNAASQAEPFCDLARWRMATIHAPTLLAYAERLEAEVERLRGVVEAAYCEGFGEGDFGGMRDTEPLWMDSDARAAPCSDSCTGADAG